MHENDAPLVNFESPLSLREIFLAWEWLRVVYNSIQVAVVVFVLMYAPRYWTTDCPAPWAGSEVGQIDWVRALLVCARNGVVANVFFLLGPTVEAYASWLGWNSAPKHLVLRCALFILGTFFTAIVAAAFVRSMLTNGFD